MNFSSVPTEPIAQKNLSINDTWFNFISDTINQLKQNLSDEGYIVSGLDSDQISMLNGLEGNRQKFVYNTTTSTMMVNNSGTFLNLSTSMLLSQSEIDAFDFSKFKHGILINTTTGDAYILHDGIKRKILLLGDE